MTTNLATDAPEKPTQPVLAHMLWHRTGSCGKWRPVGAAPTFVQALALIEASGKSGGDWIVKNAGIDPNEDR
jgi:hypothetical protein